ncbi:hypothetical protein [Arsenophonus nasoniae]|uniref:Uncharacterized protein n=1 Tax=Arsenophonus nasoniae TaxID=638 RepID=A0ABY8NM29_9GAMM|nr:hypothetical protein [Arsenophonus nasoniae]WGM04279.1 hypothetical protein QE258_11570 [Arsenophonus nasoniae]
MLFGDPVFILFDDRLCSSIGLFGRVCLFVADGGRDIAREHLVFVLDSQVFIS